ncbi:unnamed protein product [Closterium sp. Naga37s-1]|nr:unnamed protein product [Closterium sp. Naga37s-1]
MSSEQDRVDEENGSGLGTEAPGDARNLPRWFPGRGGSWSFGWKKIQIADSSAATDAATDATAASASDATAASASPTEMTGHAALSELGDYSKDGGGGEGAARASAARVWRWVWSRRDVLLMSTAFLFFFVAFNALQNVATSIHGASNIGALSMGVLYAVIVVTAPLAPFPIRFWRARAAILVAQTGFWAFIGSNAFTIEWLLLLASCYLGVCWSVVWVAQGVYLVAAAGVYSKRYNKPMDVVVTEFSALFGGIFAFNQIIGNAITFTVSQLSYSSSSSSSSSLPPTTVTILIIVLCICLAIGSVLSWLLRDLKPIEVRRVDDATLNFKRPVAALAPCPSISSSRALSIFTVDWEEMEELVEEEVEEDEEEEGEEEGAEVGEDEEEEKGREGGARGGKKAKRHLRAILSGVDEEGGEGEEEQRGEHGQGERGEVVGEDERGSVGIGDRSVSAPAASGRHSLSRSVKSKRMTVTVGGGSKEGEGRNAWQLLFDRKLLLLIPLLFYSGLQAAYISADFTRYVVQPLLGAQWMGGAMMVFGVAIAVCCFFAVRFAKGLSSIRLMLLLGAASQAAVLVLTWVFQERMQNTRIGSRGAVRPAPPTSSPTLAIAHPLPPPNTSLDPAQDAAYAHWISWSSAACSAYFLASPYIATPIKNSLLLAFCLLSVILAAIAVRIRPPGQAKPCEGV